MNRALNIKNWKDGGNSYILKGNIRNKWVGFQETVLTELLRNFDEDFNIVIWTEELDENDYYCIPFNVVKHLFTQKHKTTGKYPNRWTAIIIDHQFLMHSNSKISVNISAYYSKPLILPSTVEVVDDYYIENSKAEINRRLGQSKFRSAVLKNFAYKYALTGISELELLTASHIVPWAAKKEFRGDPSNGICLYIELDALFDKGFISLRDDLEVIVTPYISKLSNDLQEKLAKLEGRKLRAPINKPLNKEYLSYHRENVFKKY